MYIAQSMPDHQPPPWARHPWRVGLAVLVGLIVIVGATSDDSKPESQEFKNMQTMCETSVAAAMLTINPNLDITDPAVVDAMVPEINRCLLDNYKPAP